MTAIIQPFAPAAAPDRLRCVSDAYDPDGSFLYDDVDQFLAMCQDAFVDEPELTETSFGVWRDSTGEVVLVAEGNDQHAHLSIDEYRSLLQP